ncbi:formylglycine-generating enzyme family protein [Sorangium sp. So ce362]|uniref:formylglycine-generating enzyme family protein n=1 Tax=Sorangium sp. So ce362 TaxID=3133303 RepID=UPI003F610640
MEKRPRERARWLWAAWALTAGGCAMLAGLEDGYYVVEGGSGGTGTGGEAGGTVTGTGGDAGAGGEAGGTATGTGGGAGTGGETGGGTGGGTGGSGGGAECTPGGTECVGQTCVEGKCIGECGPEDVRCSENRPQRCGERGAWEDAAPCPAGARVCSRGACVTPPSCVGLAETCGPAGNESCCASAEAVPGGTFNRGNDPAYPATVNGFLLDRFEVTVGRFRRFVEAYPGSMPAAGAGRHPLIDGSGWDTRWDGNLPADAAALTAAVKCNSTYQTWRATNEGTEHLPMNCLSWYVAFAFCAWDGARLPTEAEWNYAAAGGSEQREYPWSNPAASTTIDGSHAVYECTGDGSASGACVFSDLQPVGSRSTRGDGRWGQANLAGSMYEWVLDWYTTYSDECNDCANTISASFRVLRGGGFTDDASLLLSSARSNLVPSFRYSYIGARCARTP